MDLKMEVYSPYLELLGLLEIQSSVMWESRAFSSGSFSVDSLITEDTRALLVPENIIWIEGETAGVIEYVQQQAGEEGPYITVKGRDLTGILDRCILWGQYDLSGIVPDIMRRLVDDCCIHPTRGDAENRTIPGLVLEGDISFPPVSPEPIERTIQVSVTDVSGASTALNMISSIGMLMIAGKQISETAVSITTTERNIDISYRLSKAISKERQIQVNNISIGNVKTAGDTVTTSIPATDSVAFHFALATAATASALSASATIPAIRTQKTGGTLLEALEELGEAYGVAFGVRFVPEVPRMEFWTRPSIDRTVGQTENEHVFYSTELDDVLSSEYAYNAQDYRNVALVAGEGEGKERVHVTVTGGVAPEPAVYTGFIPADSTVVMLTSDGRAFSVRAPVDEPYKSAYTGQQIDTAIANALSGGGGGTPGAGVSSFNGRTGVVVPQKGDYTAAQVGAATMQQVNAAIQAAILASWEASY